MRFAIVDDLPDHRELLVRAIERYCSAKSIDAICERFVSPESCMAAYESGRFDVVFLDGYFDGSRGEHLHQSPSGDAGSGARGIDLARWLRAQGYAGPIIFSTYSTDFAVDGYQVNAAAYMVKPYGQAEVDAVLDKVIHSGACRQTVTAQHIIELPIGARAASSIRGGIAARSAAYGRLYTVINDEHDESLLRVNTDRLAFCRADTHNVEFYDAGQPDIAALSMRIGLSSVEDALLHLPQFLVCARGYIVNLDHVSGMDGDAFMLAGSVRVPVSRRRAAEAKARYADWVFSSMRNG